jgi:Capsule polysaccharide biosynthesis protein
MATDTAFVITTLAEYQTRFWIEVARQFAAHGVTPRFISFDDRSSEMIARAGFAALAANAVEAPAPPAEILARAGIDRLAYWTSHERFAFGRTDTAAMHEKLARSVVAAERAIGEARERHGAVVMVQEVGGFLSVIGSFFAARAAGIDNWFIEPAFFRGRMMLRRNTFAAARFEQTACTPSQELHAYLDRTLERGSIVIPRKDVHLYRSAAAKVMSVNNVVRLGEKLRDKYLLGKRQEFGFIGNQVGTHLRMIRDSRRLKRHYREVGEVGRFVYYPLHVPGDMALTLRSPEYLDQIALIDFLCRTLPDGHVLALKEHPAMIGAIAAGPMRALLRRYDNLVLLSPASNNYAVMREAACIVTVNSKSGAEAGLLGKRVFVLGDAFYRDAPFAIAVERLGDLPGLLAAALAGEHADSAPPAHVDWFACAWAESLPGELYITDAERVREFAQSLLHIRDART